MKQGVWACGRGDVSTPSFGRHLNPILTRGADYAHHILMSRPSFESHRRACPTQHSEIVTSYSGPSEPELSEPLAAGISKFLVGTSLIGIGYLN